MNLSICDLCNSIGRGSLPFRFTLHDRAKNKGGAIARAEICDACCERLMSQLEQELSFEQINKPQPSTMQAPKRQPVLATKIDEDTTMVPSAMDYSRRDNTPESKCSHPETSYDPPYLKCKKCGEQWEA
jgi:hypothetical protein